VRAVALRGHAVWAFDNLNDFYKPQLKRRNLRDIQSLAKPTEFVHGNFQCGVSFFPFAAPMRRFRPACRALPSC
jgi:hypothetical protein